MGDEEPMNLAMAAARPLCEEARQPRRRTNCECITELADELWRLDRDYKRLEEAIRQTRGISRTPRRLSGPNSSRLWVNIRQP